MVAESLYANDVERLQKAITEYMDKSISFYDAGAEGFYHGLTLGLIALLDNQYKIKSNRESGDGRYDISLVPREKKYPGIMKELEKLSNEFFRSLSIKYVEVCYLPENAGAKEAWNARGYGCFCEQARKCLD